MKSKAQAQIDDLTRQLEKVTIQRNKSKQRIDRLLMQIDDLKTTIARFSGVSVDRYKADLTRVMDERDEARELAQQMSESNQVILADLRHYREEWKKLKGGAA